MPKVRQLGELERYRICMRLEYSFAKLLAGWRDILPIFFVVREAGQRKVMFYIFYQYLKNVGCSSKTAKKIVATDVYVLRYLLLLPRLKFHYFS